MSDSTNHQDSGIFCDGIKKACNETRMHVLRYSESECKVQICLEYRGENNPYEMKKVLLLLRKVTSAIENYNLDGLVEGEVETPNGDEILSFSIEPEGPIEIE